MIDEDENLKEPLSHYDFAYADSNQKAVILISNFYSQIIVWKCQT